MKKPYKKPNSLDTLTGLRAFASLWVLFGHLLFMPPYDLGFAKAVTLGSAATILQFNFIPVDLFLILSGFVLYLHHRDDFDSKPVHKAIDRFYLLRLAKLYPLHLFTLGLMGFIHIVGIAHPIFSGNQDFIFEHWPITLFINLALMNSWGMVPVASWNEPAWTISALMFVYLIFPTWVIVPKVMKSTIAQVMGIVLMSVALELSIHLIDGVSMSDGIGSLIRAATLFMVGCFTCCLYEKHPDIFGKWGDVVFILCALLLCSCIMVFVYVSDFPVLFFRLLCPVLILSLVCSGGIVKQVFSNKLVMYLGKISYSIYLMHYPALMVIKHIGGNYFASLMHTAPQWLLWLNYLGVTIVVLLVSALCYHLIEAPAYRWIKQKISPRKEQNYKHS